MEMNRVRNHTPKTIGDVINQAFAEWMLNADDKTREAIFKSHIKDFLSQKFTTAFLMPENIRGDIALTKLWNSIFPEDPR